MAKITIEGLTREQKLEMLDALEEKKRRLIDKREVYVPNAGQLPVHLSDKKIRAVFGANGMGKTAMGVNEALYAVLGYNPITKKTTTVPARVVVVLDRPEKVEQTFLPEIRKWFPLKEDQLHKKGKPYYSQITFANGSEIIFLFHDMEPMSMESIELDFAIFDEPCPRSLFVSLFRGGRKKHTNARFLFVGTPIAASWMRRELYDPWAKGERTDIECFRASTDVNKQNLADGYIESFKSVLTEKEQQVRLHGAFFDLDGLALAHLFNRKTHVIPPPRWPPGWPVVIALDPHPRKAHVGVMLGCTPDNELIALKEISSRAIPSQFAQDLKEWMKGYRVADIICDSFGSSELTGGDGNLSFIAVLRENGVRARATTYNEKSAEAWLTMITTCLAIPLEPDNFGKREPRLKVSSDLKGLINDIETVEYQRHKGIDELKPTLAIESKDFLAALKYALAAQPRYQKSSETVIRPQGPVGWANKEKWKQGKRYRRNGVE